MQQGQNAFTDEELIEQYNAMPHIGKLSAHFKVPEVQIWRKCEKLGLKFNVGGTREKISLEEILEGKHPHYQTNKLKKRMLKEGLVENKCGNCGITEWNGKHIVMQLDHINGDNKDHRMNNLQLLCPNCHSQTDTWCGKNK